MINKSKLGNKCCLNVDFWKVQTILNKTSIYNFFISQIVFFLQPIEVRCKKTRFFASKELFAHFQDVTAVTIGRLVGKEVEVEMPAVEEETAVASSIVS